jgi:hypothetical protein
MGFQFHCSSSSYYSYWNWNHVRDHARKNYVRLYASSSSSSDKERRWQGLGRSAAYSLLKQQLAVAAKFEVYISFP